MSKARSARRRWTAAQIKKLRTLYPGHYTRDVARRLRMKINRVNAKASQLGLRKNTAFRKRELDRQARRLRAAGSAYRFPKGHVPANKGLRRPGWAPGRMRETQFKKGQFPFNRDPEFYVLGALRVNTDGYIDMRISFDKGALGWKPLHRILWEDARGAVPKKHCLRFIDGDKLNVCLENIELIHRGDNMRRNSMHNMPKPLKDTIRALGQLKRRIRERRDGTA
jgi:hypothetical protein